MFFLLVSSFPPYMVLLTKLLRYSLKDNVQLGFSASLCSDAFFICSAELTRIIDLAVIWVITLEAQY